MKKFIIMILLSTFSLSCNAKSLVGIDALYKKDDSRNQKQNKLQVDFSKGKNETENNQQADTIENKNVIHQGTTESGVVKIIGAIFGGILSLGGVFVVGVKKKNAQQKKVEARHGHLRTAIDVASRTHPDACETIVYVYDQLKRGIK